MNKLFWADNVRGEIKAPYIAFVLSVVGSIILFLSMFRASVIVAGDEVWQNPPTDMAQMMSGYLAFLRTEWAFPPTITTAVIAPNPVSIVYTDSVPWLALALKALGVGYLLNPLGLFLLLSYLLQAVGAVTLLSALGVRRTATLVAGAILLLLYPPWLVRQFGHISLTAHWLILFAASLAISSAKHGITRARALGFVSLGALATGIHAYHLVPVGTCVGASIAAEFVRGSQGRRGLALVTAFGFAAAVASASMVLGYGIGQGVSNGGDVLGLFSMNLLGPVWPQASTLAGQRWDGDWFTGTVDATGGQRFEGFNYLGGGILLIIVAACVGQARHQTVTKAVSIRPFLPLLVALVLLTLLAIGPNVGVGNYLLLEIPKPQGHLGDTVALFRAHGRFFWLVAYVVFAYAVSLVDRHRLEVAMPILAIAVLLQVVDMSRLRAAVTARWAVPDHRYYPLAFADAPELAGRPFVFDPDYFCADFAYDRIAISQLTFAAIRSGGSSNAGPVARPQDVGCAPTTTALHTASATDRTVTLVVDTDPTARGRFAAFSERSDCYRFSRGLICGSGLERLPEIEALAVGTLAPAWPASDAVLSVMGNDLLYYLGDGWSTSEGEAIWTNGEAATLAMRVPQDVSAVDVTLEATGYSPQPNGQQHVSVDYAGFDIGSLTIASGRWGKYSIRVPINSNRDGALVLLLRLPDALIPPTNDKRRLGIALKSVGVKYLY